ncbi:hypothetical protein SLA2020_075490 [Shorea laevis]
MLVVLIYLLLSTLIPPGIDDYVHRIGWSGCAGKTEPATAFFNENNLSLAMPLADLMQEANKERSCLAHSFCVTGFLWWKQKSTVWRRAFWRA